MTSATSHEGGRTSSGGHRESKASGGVLQQYRVVRQLSAIFDVTLAPLAVVTLGLIIIEFLVSLRPPWNAVVYWAQIGIWGVFLAAFVLEMTLAPHKLLYLRRNWLLIIALAIPAVRVFRVAEAVRVLRTGRAVRGLTLARSATALKRGLSAVQGFLGFSQIALVGVVALLVWLVCSGLVYYLEQGSGSGLGQVGEALWWSASILTTVGISAEPVTIEGRVIAVLLRLFGVAVVGYITARLAAYFLGGSRPEDNLDELRALKEEILSLRRELSGGMTQSGHVEDTRDRRAG